MLNLYIQFLPLLLLLSLLSLLSKCSLFYSNHPLQTVWEMSPFEKVDNGHVNAQIKQKEKRRSAGNTSESLLVIFKRDNYSLFFINPLLFTRLY